MKTVRRIAAPLSLLLSLFGVYWLPKDAADWRQAAEPWGQLLRLVDQNTALWIFSSACCLYILLASIWPAFSRWIDNWPHRRQADFKVKLAICQEAEATILPRTDSVRAALLFAKEEWWKSDPKSSWFIVIAQACNWRIRGLDAKRLEFSMPSFAGKSMKEVDELLYFMLHEATNLRFFGAIRDVGSKHGVPNLANCGIPLEQSVDGFLRKCVVAFAEYKSVIPKTTNYLKTSDT